MKSRRSCCESLESRRLLAGDVCLAQAFTESEATATEMTTALVASDSPIATSAAEAESLAMTHSSQDHRALGAGGTPGDLLVERGDRVAALRLEYGAAASPSEAQPVVYLFERASDGSLHELAASNVGFDVQQLLFIADSLIVAGQSGDFHGDHGAVDAATSPTTHVRVLSHDDLSQRQDLSLEGALASVVQSGDRLYVSTRQTSEASIQIVPPPPDRYQVSVFEADEGELHRIAAGATLAPVRGDSVVGDDLILLEQHLREDESSQSDQATGSTAPSNLAPWDFVNRLQRYRINGTSLQRVASLELPAGLDPQLEIARDGQTATAVIPRTDVWLADGDGPRVPALQVLLIDLSQDQPARFETVAVPTPLDRPAFTIGERAVVLARGTEVIVVDTDQTVDLDAESRVTRAPLETLAPQHLPVVTGVTEVTADQYVITRPLPADPGTPGDVWGRRHQVLVFSLAENGVRSQGVIASSELAVLAGPMNKPTLVDLGLPADQAFTLAERSLSVAEISAADQFQQRGDISLAGTLELDATAERLLLRQLDQLVEHAWDALAAPEVTPLGSSLAPTAVDDAFRINSESRDHYLEVLENDDFPIAPALVPGQIVDLIEAPQGVEIAPGGRLIRLSEDLLAAGGSHQFQYTLGQGAARSTANVELTLYRYRETEVQAILEQIVAQAAEALQVAPETLTVGAEWRFTGRPMPDELAPGLENPLAGRYGLVLDLLAGDQLVRYAGDFQGRVVQLSHRPLETAMELRMSAVDGQGNPLERIASGETFFIEITAEDLRAFGQGVFAAAFDLSVPAAQLELTGDLQLLGAFDDLGGEKSATGIDEFVAVELLLKHPGGGPQPIVRIGVRAVAGGDVMLRLDPADSVGAELLLRGRDDLVSPLEVRFGTLELAIDGIRPTDTDANGATTPRDALRVINFLARHGSRDIEELTALSALAEAEQAEGSVVSSRRLDTNADGRVSALDALTVINAIARNLPPRAEGETLASPLETMPLASDWLAEDDRR